MNKSAKKKKKQPFFVHGSSCVEEDVSIGEGTRIWYFCHIREGTRIGRDCNIGQSVFIGRNVAIGNGVKVQNNVSIYECVTIEDYVFCGPSCVFTNVRAPRSEYPKSYPDEYSKTRVRRGATLGANSTIVAPCTIGRYALVGAGSVVTRDVPDYALVVGNPARRIGWVCECGRRLSKQGGEAMRCEACGRKFMLCSNEVRRLDAD